MLRLPQQKSVPLFSALTALAFSLTGCFQNMSGSESLLSKSSQKTGFTDTTPSGGGAFDGTLLQANGAVVNSYAGTDADGTYNGSYGLVINLQKSFETAIGAATLTDLLARSTEAAVTSMPVEVSIPAFHIKAKFLFGKVVSDRKLLNVMVIRPNLAGVDFASGYIPETAPLVQTTPRYVYSYGGVEAGDTAIARMTMFYRNTNPYGTGFLPNITNPAWGQNFPSEADATANAEFMRLTVDLGKILYGICTDPNTNGFICDTSFAGVQSSPENYLLAIHKTAGVIKKAWVIYPTAGAPKGLELCNSNYDGQLSNYVITNSANNQVTYEVADKRACDCGPDTLESIAAANSQALPSADRVKLFDYCRNPALGSPFGINSAKGVPNKITYLNSAVTNKPVAPTSGTLTPPAGPVNDITFISI